jgi:uncharacterized lipoprotein YddW (UPF0748 family)
MRRCLLLLSLLLPSQPAFAELRGLWVVRTGLTSPQSVDRVVDQALAGGFNALFVQVRGRGDAFYDSRKAPRSVLLANQPASFDPLARLIERAAAHKLEVHGWINVLLCQDFPRAIPAGHVLQEHPDWVMVPRSASWTAAQAQPLGVPWIVRQAARGKPDIEGLYVSPSAPGLPEYLEGVVRELVRGYPLAGLHLDFIRYPNADYDWSRHALAGFQRLTGRANPAQDPRAFADYQRDTLTALLERLSLAAREERKGLQISAAVVPDEALAVNQRFQDWPQWLSRGILDAVCPMAYTENARVFRAQVERARMLAGPTRAVWVGVGAYRMGLPGIVEKIQVARATGASGVILFSQESLSPGDLLGLRQGVFLTPVATAPMLAGAGGAR